MTVLAFIFKTTLVAQTPPINPILSESQKQTLYQEIHSLLQKYREVPLAPDSQDFGLFATVGKAAQTNPEFVDKLIDLTAIQEVPPDTTEKLSPTRLSPAGRELLIIGGGVKASIQARLDRGDLTTQQKAVLNDVIHFLDLRATKSPQVAVPLKPSGQQSETADPSGRLAPTSLPTSIQPPAPKKTPGSKFVSAPSEEPTSSTPWSISVVLIVAALGLLWLRLKRRL